MNYTPTPEERDPAPRMVDCTDRPDAIEACGQNTLTSPRGGYVGGRFLVYADSLAEWQGKDWVDRMPPERVRKERKK